MHVYPASVKWNMMMNMLPSEVRTKDVAHILPCPAELAYALALNAGGKNAIKEKTRYSVSASRARLAHAMFSRRYDIKRRRKALKEAIFTVGACGVAPVSFH